MPIYSTVEVFDTWEPVYLGVQALQVGTDVLDAGSKRVDVQERRNDP